MEQAPSRTPAHPLQLRHLVRREQPQPLGSRHPGRAPPLALGHEQALHDGERPPSSYCGLGSCGSNAPRLLLPAPRHRVHQPQRFDLVHHQLFPTLVLCVLVDHRQSAAAQHRQRVTPTAAAAAKEPARARQFHGMPCKLYTAQQRAAAAALCLSLGPLSVLLVRGV